ncbi:MAG TPA: stage II sporulation protein E [Clostridia bacterium]|nr:stage II sporulation protein E [Clostridia bacterium]
MKTITIPMSKAGNFTGFLRKAILDQNNYLVLLTAFLLGSSNIASGLLPFGAAFFAASCGTAGIKMLTVAAVIIGAATQGSLELIYINAACMLLFSVLSIPLKERKSKLDVKPALLLFTSMLVPQMMLAGLQGFLLYDILKAFFSSFISFVLFFIFNFSMPVITGAVKKAMLCGEEAVSLAVTATLALTGIGTLQIAGFSLRNIFCVLLLLLFSYKCGAGVGAAAGAAIGLIIGVSEDFTPSVAGTYALCGMLAGILGNLGRLGTSLGFLLGNVLLAVYFNGSAESMLYLRDIIAAGVLIFFVPESLISRVTRPFARSAAFGEDLTGYTGRIKDITVERLEKFSKAFKDLSKTFDEIAETKMPAETQEINVLFDRVADRICSDCSLCMHCWERNFYDTYQVMFKIVESLEMKGRIEESDVPDYFLNKCPRIHEFVNAVNNMYELFRVGVVWKGRLNESRTVISRQFEGMSRVISSLAGEINSEVNFLSPLEDAVMDELKQQNIKVREVIAYKNAWDKYEINVLHNACGGARSCAVIEKTVSEACGRKMVRATEGCSKGRDGACMLKFVEAENLKLTTGIARLPKYGSNISGDNFTFLNGGYGKYTLALSDGMGTGQGAALQSKATVNMLESFLESGFDKDMAVNLINSVLVLKSEEDNTCTIDMTVVDLFSGEVEFIKIGAAPTYIRKESKVEIIRSASLPAGILPGIDAELARRNVEGGDMIIMVTDGIIDSMAGDDPGDRQLMKFIQQLESLNPQEVADSILNEASSCCDGKPCDDLTVLVTKVWKKPR